MKLFTKVACAIASLGPCGVWVAQGSALAEGDAAGVGVRTLISSMSIITCGSNEISAAPRNSHTFVFRSEKSYIGGIKREKELDCSDISNMGLDECRYLSSVRSLQLTEKLTSSGWVRCE